MFVGHYNVSPRGFSLIVLLQKSFFLKSFEHSKIFLLEICQIYFFL